MRDGGLELATVNPTGVLGPVLGPDYSPSLTAIARMLDGSMPALLPFATGYVDVGKPISDATALCIPTAEYGHPRSAESPTHKSE